MKKIIAIALAAVVSLSAFAGGERKPVIVAHRGGANMGIENSLSCMQKGIDAGADWLETDVHLSKDGVLIVCHDPDVDRTTDGKGAISSMTLKELKELRLLDAEGNPTQETLPTLDELMDLIHGQIPLLLEIKYSKTTLEGIEQACLDCIARHDAQDWVIIQSFDDRAIEKVHELSPETPVQKLLFYALPWTSLKKYSYAGAVNIFKPFASRRFIKKAHAAGLKAGAWTYNEFDAKALERLDILITNSPDVFAGKR